VILHESVHATVYVPSQSAFNESLASFIADELTWRLVVGRGGLESDEAKAWLAGEERGARFVAALHRAYEELDALYRSAQSDEEKRAKKAARLEALQRELGVKRQYNNADLAGFKTYDTGRPAFARLLRACEGLPKFLAAVKTLKERDFPQKQATEFGPVVDALAARACRAP
jgi:predicted aminopeptidase